MKNFFSKIGGFLLKYIKIVAPVAVAVIAGVVGVIALNVRNNKDVITPLATVAQQPEATTEPEEPEVIEAPLQENHDAEIEALIRTFYDHLSNGEIDAAVAMCDTMEETEILRNAAQAEYITYELQNIYVQEGNVEGTYITYAYCLVHFDQADIVSLPAYFGHYIRTAEDGSLYFVNGILTAEENEYITMVTTQDDVVEMNNRLTVEYNEVVESHPEILTYLSEMDSVVNNAIGEALASRNEEAAAEETEEPIEGTEETPVEETTPEETIAEPVEEEPKYATATTTVNVRSSDSENADKLGKLANGTKVLVKEVQINGWTKIDYNGKDGFVKTDYLKLVESASSAKKIGTVSAISTVNIRSSADQSSDRLGVLAQGEILDLVANEGEWCKIKYNGQIGYVKTEFVTILLDN